MLKGILMILSTLLSSAVAFSQQAELSFDRAIHKFDAIEEGALLEHAFHFKNEGDAPLIITRYEVECTCTKVSFPKEPIFPGEEGEVRVTFDTHGKIGWQYRKIRLFSSATSEATELEIRVKVKPGKS